MIMITEAEIDAAAKAYCCPECDCIPSASYCSVKNEREMIRRILVAARKTEPANGVG